MNSKIEKVTVTDSNALANEIMHDIIDVEQMERTFEVELTSEELFRIDSAILASLRSTKDFSRDLLHQLETGQLKNFAVDPPKSEDFSFEDIQMNVLNDLTLPLQKMFDQMADYITEDMFCR